MERQELYGTEQELFTQQTLFLGKDGGGKTFTTKENLNRVETYLEGKADVLLYVLDVHNNWEEELNQKDYSKKHFKIPETFLNEVIQEMQRRILLNGDRLEKEPHFVMVLDSLHPSLLEEGTNSRQFEFILNNTHLLGITVFMTTSKETIPSWLLEKVDNVIEVELP